MMFAILLLSVPPPLSFLSLFITLERGRESVSPFPSPGHGMPPPTRYLPTYVATAHQVYVHIYRTRCSSILQFVSWNEMPMSFIITNIDLFGCPLSNTHTHTHTHFWVFGYVCDEQCWLCYAFHPYLSHTSKERRTSCEYECPYCWDAMIQKARRAIATVHVLSLY
ncbi:hypothetical protein F4808DRAFT_210569 [Astrocystis sublimbata]|nr:hypothetical protein F4808DRAFT_210569 [Astrocystis sublimbata]